MQRNCGLAATTAQHLFAQHRVLVKAVPQTVTGFTTKQQDIADYGSAQEGELMPAVNAQYPGCRKARWWWIKRRFCPESWQDDQL